MSNASLVELTFSFSQPKLTPALVQFLKQQGFERSEIIETSQKNLHSVRVYLPGKAHRLEKIRIALELQGYSRVKFSCRSMKLSDWADKWKEDYVIQTLGRQFVLVPSWRKNEFKEKDYKKRIPILMDPQSAFGSGEHETTRLIVKMLEKLSGKFKSFIDVGTGTGILSIVAAHLSAERILAFDCDKPSVKCADFNFRRNVSKSILASFKCWELARFKSMRKFDLVCANINSHILERHRRQIVTAAKKGGYVLVSGILHQTYKSFRDAFDGKDLRCMKVLKGRRWVAVLFRKF